MDVIHDIIQPLSPATPADWLGGNDIRHTLPPPCTSYPIRQWYHQGHGLNVLSAVEVAVDTDNVQRGPEYHISVTFNDGSGPQRCSKEHALWVLTEFGDLQGWEEDNHVPNGKTRNFWRPVAEPMIGRECACKETEHLVIEGDYEHRPLE